MKIKFYLSFLTLIGIGLSGQTATAQTYQPSNRIPVADNTLGTQVSVNGNNFNITGGINKGQSLFHSFTDFSVPTSGQANFLNPVGNRDIITRVTGTLFSDINGLVNTNGANFFLINPNGIVFGTNAQLNVGKAFVGSTANSLDLVGGGRTITFGTNPSGDAPLLSVAPNVLFDVSRLNLGGGSGAISNFGTLQTTNPNQYIGLIGGNISLDGSNSGGKIIAPGGRIDIGGLNTAGTVTVDNNGLVYGGSRLQRSNVVLRNGAGVTVRATGTLDTVNTFFNNATAPGSSINISANNIDILNSGAKLNDQPAAIDSGFDINSGVQTQTTGNINLNATNKVNLDNSDIKNTLRTGTEGNIGDINLQASALDLKNQSLISSSTSGKGNAGNISLKVNGAINLINGGQIITDTTKTAQGNGGDINIQATGNIGIAGSESAKSLISSDTDGQGDTGKITIDTQSKLILANRGVITSSINQTGEGNGKGIFITARELELANRSYISTGTSQLQRVDGKGNAGDISIKTTGDIKISGYDSSAINPTRSDLSFIDSNITGQGNSGKITIDTQGKLLVFNQGAISNTIFFDAIGNSQGININARELELANGGLIDSGTFQTTPVDGKGNAGDINIKTTGDIQISRSLITSSSLGQGNAAKIVIDAQGKFSINKGFVLSNISEKATGSGRGIFITAQELALNNSFVGSSSSQTNPISSNNQAGDIDIKVQRAIQSKGSVINTFSGGTGKSGNISITSDKLLLNKTRIFSAGVSVAGGDITISVGDKLLMQNTSFINSQSDSGQLNDNGGNVSITSPLIIALPGNNDITADAKNGNGGNVRIVSQGLFGIQFRPKGQESTFTNDITASSTFGQSGNVNIDTPGTDPGKDSTQLPTVTTDTSNQISQVCSANTRENKLIVTGRGGLPPNANDPLTSDVVWQDARAVTSQPVGSNATNSAKLVPPAVGWVFNGKGKVTLVAAGTQGQPTGTRVVCPTVAK